ncbi:Rho guanyl nucleotide exchange factor [Teratosphaeria destructans]|uniref:Rho guanyl nucleotide exchange factor n=1 Tax=Teratosphaeria destructans TaxID=418781 RepID=A0A9W7SW11_9PEZI|nr:Rho guanyl nucleotide exchange factor [Teratosphaeria destructans]
MAVVIPGPPALAGDLVLFHTTDPLLSNSPVLVFHGPAATIAATSSRIQVHVFTPAGIASYLRVAVAPNSPFWSAVDSLPRDAKGDEVCRGIAFGLKRYFAELPESVKKTWCTQVKAPSSGMLFGDQHVAILASRMQKIDNTDEVIQTLGQAFAEQRQSWLDVDVVLPPGCVKETSRRADSLGSEDVSEADVLHQRYGRYAELVAALGDTTFMPTSKMKRAPSKSTSVGRSASFLRHQKESVRKELTELVETEASYLDRIKELQDIAATVGADLKESSRQQIQSVFPDTLGKIVDLNSKFWEALKPLLEDTETSALADIEITSDTDASVQQIRRDLVEDAQGVVAVAKCLCEWLPQFAEAYQPYVQAHAEASQLLRELFRSTDTALAAELQEIGEQKLCSLLIEPVQRLPRYNLYIDGMAKQLPARHPAIKLLLRARDVVTEICSSDDASTEIASMEEKLRMHVPDWPEDCHLAGRLVAVVDYTSLAAPFLLPGSEAERGSLLVFTDGLVFLEKRGESSIGARALQTQLEAGTMAPRPLSLTTSELSFVRRVQLNACDCVESRSGRVLQIYTRFQLDLEAMASLPLNVDSCQSLLLEGSYEGKAARLVQDILKARTEARFGEPERESARWEVRASDASADHSSLLSALFDDSNPDFVAGRRGCAATRILIDIDKHSLRPRAGQGGIRTVIAVSPLKDGLWRMTVDSIDGNATREHLAITELMSVLNKRLNQLSAARFAIQQPTMTSCLLNKAAQTIASIGLHFQSDDDEDDSMSDDRERYRRPKSPRKLITSFLASTGPGGQPPALLKKDLPALPPPTQGRSAHSGQISKPPSRESRPSSKDQPRPHTSYAVGAKQSVDPLPGPLKKLDDSMKTYILALKARKGNIVGRSLKMRATADELAVNELYNGLLEDPNMMVLAAQATVDVLFAAFEKFLNIAWKEQVGQVMPYSLIQDVQSKAESLFPADFDQYFRVALSTLAPQNKRAFKGIMELLADLLDGTGNDGDRGALTVAFAEVLVTEGNPHEFIALIDRFVDDTDTYFGEPIEEVSKPGDGHGSLHKRARSVNSASISSNTSSLRKKFGFGHLHRSNSRSEEESKVSAVWRTLSKSTRGEASPVNSISRASLHRSHSTDLDARLNPKRPSSQDGPSLKPSPFDDVPSTAAASAQSLGTIGEHPSFIPTGPPRKKRRSSLSDLHGNDDTPKAQTWMSPPAPRRPPLFARATSPDPKALLSSPPQSMSAGKPDFGRLGSPFRDRDTPRSRLPSSFRRESSPVANRAFGVVEPLQLRRGSKQADEITITARTSTSGIPTLAPKSGIPQKTTSPSPRVGLSERAGAGNIVKRPATSSGKDDQSLTSTPVLSTPQRKLRMQSPQKLRERLQNEQGSLTATQTSLQDELAKIGEELTATAAPSRAGSNRTRANTIGPRNGLSGKPSSTDLAQRVLKMEGSVVKLGDDFKARLDGLQADLSSSLTVSENKCKKLDELYREVHSENDALYTRFNDELSRVLKAVKGGEGVEELKKQLRESQEEAAKLRRETGRLKRENVGLRAQMRE